MMTRRVLVAEEHGVIDAFRQKAGQSHDEEELEEVEHVAQEDAEKTWFTWKIKLSSCFFCNVKVRVSQY